MKLGIATCASLLALLTACSGSHHSAPKPSDSATPTTSGVQGRLAQVGGPGAGTARGVPGTVTVTQIDTNQPGVTVTVGADGHYLIHLQPGLYQLSGRFGSVTCHGLSLLTVQRNQITTADTICSVS